MQNYIPIHSKCNKSILLSVYSYCMQWTDRIRQVKIFLVIAAILIALASLIVSHFLVKDLAIEEHNKMEVWAEAYAYLK